MKLIITGGGTAGHINPGIAIARHIREKYPQAEVLFIGTEKGLEKDLVPKEGFKITFIKARGFNRKLSFDIVLTTLDMAAGYIEAKKIIKTFKPDVVVGTGGYVCLPALLAAVRLKVPTLIHESNAFPGITNRLLGKLVDAVAISFKESEKNFKGAKRIILTGNPVRPEILSMSKNEVRADEAADPQPALVLIFGGSRGAERINKAVIDMIALNGGKLPYNLIVSTGQVKFDTVVKSLEEKDFPIQNLENIKIVPYIFDMAQTIADADLVVSRAGAVTISEITAVGIPSILIPFPFATENHQEYNARSLEKQGAAIVILEKDLSPDILNQQIMSLINNREQMNRMAKNAKKMGVVDAVEKIGAIIEELIKK